jgi:filamentous hemagglutinin
MRKEPQVVQWAVLGQIRQERTQNLQTQQQILNELQGMNQRGEVGPQAAQRRGEIVSQLNLLEQENQVMRQASVEQLKAMGSAGTTNPASHREWIEGSGEAIAASRLTLQGASSASIIGRINALKGAVEEVQAASAVAKAEAQALAKARVELNARTDDAQQYVKNNAPIQVPNTVTRNDNDFTSTVNQRGNPKANIEENGNLVAANPKGTGSPTAHVSGSNPGNTPYISTTDAASVDPTLGGPKVYGTQQTTINARELQRDINSGAASQDIKIITNQQLVDQLQTKVDVAQRRFDANPSRDNRTDLDKVNQLLNFAKRDGEVLITPYVPPAYYTNPTGSVTPIVPATNVPKTPTAPVQPIK